MTAAPPPIDRCPDCGAWRWRTVCDTCAVRHVGGISQNAMPPYTMKCSRCGKTWTPEPAKGRKEVTDSRLDAVAEEHFRKCRPVASLL